ncbi:3'-5' exonuclease [Moraxella cuniculi]|uniref:Predicted 3'-5' exonuclease related to the exonuclease domain of PolB n=1 Tax=Moraxella cuniculi TaxID=34061 RepID=A0A448GV93_9GAMM|nr:3'-5' exonuclease [Moraxella cuniculi]VEG12691.1 Predicted 3'-5' exonuclease related to the exonuclease domain of PolB [Moraxella cuniculi]
MLSNTPILVFDIETIPDVATGKRLYPDIATLNDADALTALTALRQAEAGTDFMRLPLHKIACLSFLWFDGQNFHLKSLSLENLSEKEILSTFLRAFDKKPTLVSWNGSGFDIPVIMYRAMHHKIAAASLFNSAQKPDYLYRYGDMHIDLMDKMSLYNGYQRQRLDTVASLCGFAGKGDIDGSQVVPMVQAGEWEKLCNYCEADVINTWLIYLRWLILTGKASLDDYEALMTDTYQFISTLYNHDGSVRHQQFLDDRQ